MQRNSNGSIGVEPGEAPDQAAAGEVRPSRWDGLTALVERLPMGAELTAVLGHALPLPPQDADTALMLRFQAGEAACFDQLVGRFQRPLLAYLYRMVRDYSASEELLQETFLRVHLHRGRYRPKAQFNTWLYRIATHLALNYIRDHRRDRMLQPIEAEDGETPAGVELRDRAPSAEAALVAESVARERRNRVRTAIMALPPRQQAAVVLHRYQELDYAQIGETLQMSVSAIKSLLFRAYASLRRELEDLL